MSFEELRLAEPLVRAVATEGYTEPTPIQEKAIPAVLAGKDVLACAQTGTGKTGAFALPVLHRLAGSSAGRSVRGRRRPRGGAPGRRPRALVLCPTRELATQIHESFSAYGRHLELRHTVVFGGVKQQTQVRSLRNGTDVLVATPGRLLDLLEQGCVDLDGIEVLILDEADRMLDMGFIRDIRRVIKNIPVKRQTLLFSATMPDEIRTLADSILRDPAFVKVAPVASTADAICQSVYHVTKKNKPVLLERLLRHDAVERTLIFTRTKYGADKLVKILRRSGIESAAIHGNKTQGARTKALAGFKSGRKPILIATDIASRGIDVDEITHVINYELPNIPETYVHRIGRTARAGASGIAVSLCDVDEIPHLRAIERLIGQGVHVATNAPDLVYEAPPEQPPKTKKAERPASRSSRQPSKQTPRRRRRRRGAQSGRPRKSAASRSR